MRSHCANAHIEIARDERSGFLGANIVRIVVATRERVGADENAPLHFGPETGSARFFVHRADVVPLDPQPVADAVETRQVRRTLGRSDQIIRCNPIIGSRQRHVDQLGSQALEVPVGATIDGVELVAERFGVELAHDADPKATQILAQRAGSALDRPIDRGCVHWIVTGHRIVCERGIFDAARQRADLVEARRKGNQSVARHAAIGRLESHEIAERARLANRTPGIAPHADRRFVRGNGCGGAAARAARHAS